MADITTKQIINKLGSGIINYFSVYVASSDSCRERGEENVMPQGLYQVIKSYVDHILSAEEIAPHIREQLTNASREGLKSLAEILQISNDTHIAKALKLPRIRQELSMLVSEYEKISGFQK